MDQLNGDELTMTQNNIYVIQNSNNLIDSKNLKGISDDVSSVKFNNFSIQNMSLNINNVEKFKKVLGKLDFQFSNDSGNVVGDVKLSKAVSIEEEPFNVTSKWWFWTIIGVVIVLLIIIIIIFVSKKKKTEGDEYVRVEEKLPIEKDTIVATKTGTM